MSKLSILIPSFKEKHLQRTVDGIKSKAEGEIEVLWREDYGIGQRALTNELVEESTGDYIMKTDAHCIFSKGFDVDMLNKMEDNMIMSPRLLVLDEETWTPKPEPKSSSYCFDPDLVMQYNTEAENLDTVNETMCLQGSAWMVSKGNYWKWNLGDETLGSWGGQGVELGIKAYLNGGKCVTNKLAWYAHLFREDETDFPYKRDKKVIKATTDEILKRFKNKSIKGLIERYNFPSGWTEELVDKL